MPIDLCNPLAYKQSGMNPQVEQSPFVLAAILAGRLYRMLETARSMNISSSNAKGISIRGGDKTAGFKPITDFISDMVKDTIDISSKINNTALHFSITAVNEKRAVAALNSFNRAKSRTEDQARAASLQNRLLPLQDKIQAYREQQCNYCKNLEVLFDDVTQRIRAARIIVTNSRTEASRAGEYQANLFSIADDLEYCSQRIADEIKICKQHLEQLTKMIGRT
jgi:hypothetical protein